MRSLRVFLASVILIWGGGGTVLADAAISITEKAALQATMQTHINRQLVEGVYLHLKKDTGKIRRLYPVSAHPIILQVGKYFVLCSDFRDKSGKKANIDFYIARGDTGYIVFEAVVDDRKRLGLFRKSSS
jgi:hypothetical protein